MQALKQNRTKELGFVSPLDSSWRHVIQHRKIQRKPDFRDNRVIHRVSTNNTIQDRVARILRLTGNTSLGKQ